MREGFITGHMADGLDILINGRSGPIDSFFENPQLRQPRLAIIKSFRAGELSSEQAAEAYYNEQQSILNVLFN